MKSRADSSSPAVPETESRSLRGDRDVSRERLQQAALRLFAEQGYEKTSIRQIALAARVNVAAVKYYFGDKAGLYRAVFVPPQAPDGTAASIAIPPGSVRVFLSCLYARFLDPLKRGEEIRLRLKLHRREMLEPTGLWKEKIDNGIRPMHAAVASMLCSRFGLARPDDEVHRLAISVAGLAVHLYVGCDVIEALAPQLSKTPQALDLWRERLVDYAEAMIAAERRRRARQAALPATGHPARRRGAAAAKQTR
ncbi:MAG TPA: CerR family C-terminal domain-containing protein [Ramlibacter sp.]|nr:CerR family C-terminal domain-containing protein [Ramlibacter sp.]